MTSFMIGTKGFCELLLELSGATPTRTNRKPPPAAHWGPPVVENKSFPSSAFSHLPRVTFHFTPTFRNMIIKNKTKTFALCLC